MPPHAHSKQLKGLCLPSVVALCSSVFPSALSKQLKCQAKPTQSRQPRVLSEECWASLQRISSAGRKLHYHKAFVSFDCPLGLLYFLSYFRCLLFSLSVLLPFPSFSLFSFLSVTSLFFSTHPHELR